MDNKAVTVSSLYMFDLQVISESVIHTVAFEQVQQGASHYFQPSCSC